MIRFFIIIILTTWTTLANAENLTWNHVQCGIENSPEFIKIKVHDKNQIDITTFHTRYLVINMPCRSISNKGPYLACNTGDSEMKSLYSYKTTTVGYLSPWTLSDENEDDIIFVLERVYINPKGERSQIKKEYKFSISQCEWGLK